MGHYCVSDHVILRNFKLILWLLKVSCLLVNWSLCKRNSSIIWNEKQIKNLEKTIFRKNKLWFSVDSIVEECVLTKSPCDILPYFFLLFLIFYECIERGLFFNFLILLMGSDTSSPLSLSSVSMTAQRVPQSLRLLLAMKYRVFHVEKYDQSQYKCDILRK